MEIKEKRAKKILNTKININGKITTRSNFVKNIKEVKIQINEWEIHESPEYNLIKKLEEKIEYPIRRNANETITSLQARIKKIKEKENYLGIQDNKKEYKITKTEYEFFKKLNE